jgi:hypothetical protein
MVDFPGRREVEAEIRRAANPGGMLLNDGRVNVRLPASVLPLMLRMIDEAEEAREEGFNEGYHEGRGL